MLIQTQTKSKSRLPLLIILGILGVITIVVAFRAYSGGGDITPVADLQVAPSISTNFDTTVLNDVRIKGLKQYGPSEVQVAERGRRPDPFVAF